MQSSETKQTLPLSLSSLLRQTRTPPLFMIHRLSLFLCLSASVFGADLFDKPNLAAWCIVPFDAVKRSPEARAEMVAKMGIKKIAYDWRQEHVAEFEREILA